MLSPRASAARAPNSTARQFSTGNAPGKPRHTGHVFEFGSSPNRVEQPQKIFDSVLNCAWISSPMMVSQLFTVQAKSAEYAHRALRLPAHATAPTNLRA